ncbi:hypothetical protein [Carnobacterium sp.]|uniref:hypothetical protein n=1 Tax=Carnobacterium sp. TaxID=48221 RepID=UPI0028A61940|nr:hypothetical protein [Carnobacterium sp.]
MKNLPILIVLAGFFLVGCSSNSLSEPPKDSASFSSTSESVSEYVSEKEKDTVLYHGVVKETEAKENQRIFIKNFVPDASVADLPTYDEVILSVSEDTPLIDKQTEKSLTLEEIKGNAQVDVFLLGNFPVTMSIPPQIPGMSVVKVEVEQ